MRLGILGGTFDPIHQGHLLLAETAYAQYHLDKVLFIPAFIPPHKAAKRTLTPAPYRYKMVELALQNYPHFEVNSIEFDRPDISYTVDTLRKLKKKYSRDDFFLIVGADCVAEFPTWKEFGEIQKLAVILAARRPGFAATAPVGFKVDWIDMPECNISASRIREQLAGQTSERGILPPEVETYIRKMNLYQKEKSEFAS